jgi:asparagine synthase (glutamine-hydrolysing)
MDPAARPSGRKTGKLRRSLAEVETETPLTPTYLLTEPSTETMSRLHLSWNWDPGEAPSTPVNRTASRTASGEASGAAELDQFTISACARLDNRYELCALLDIGRDDASDCADEELIAVAYSEWGEGCLEKLIGDFAFAVWDPRSRSLFCARDAFGVKPFYYYSCEDFFVCASEVETVLAHPQVPGEIDRGRVADFLVSHLEGVDNTSTFYKEIYRLPPAHILEVTPEGFKKRCYWQLTPKDELLLGSDAEYARAFWTELSIAVARRHGDIRKTAVMLSGGLDSSSIVAAAREIDPEERRAVRTISLVADRERHCVETDCIGAVIDQESIKSRLLSIDHLVPYLSQVFDSIRDSSDPFDCWMNLPRVVYVAAQRAGFTAVIDGVDGDLVVSHGASLIPSLLRTGHWSRALEESRGKSQFHCRDRSATKILLGSARRAWIPERARRARRRISDVAWMESHIAGTVIHPELAREVELRDRLESLEKWSNGNLKDLRQCQADLISHPYTVAALERYHRAGVAFGVEPLHPYFDRELVEFCLSLPSDQRVKCGWTKYVVRQAVQGRLPNDVVWRKGDWRRLNSSVTEKLLEYERDQVGDLIETGLAGPLEGLVDEEAVRGCWDRHQQNGDSDDAEVVWQVAALAMWLEESPRT